MLTDIEIAQSAKLRPIVEIAGRVGLGEDDIEPYGRYKAKVHADSIIAGAKRQGRLVLVTGINPTPAGEGKSTVSVGLADALQLIGRDVVLCLREPSLGPVFGVKGGATGGGYSQVVPMEDINLHFTGDFHAISTAHALLSAMLDNHLQQGNALGIDARRIKWKRTIDMNDRALRKIVIGLGGTGDGIPREDGFLITAASEVMAIFTLSSDRSDLEQRLSRIILGYGRDGQPVRAGDIGASGAMTLLLKDALQPNLVQTLGGVPAFIHGGPFGNIAHGCNSLIATRTGLALGDIVVTEAGFGADLGAEKFFDIKCRAGGLRPEAAVIVATIRALKMHGGVALADLAHDNVAALEQGFANLQRHIENVRKFGIAPIVSINRFATDSAAELQSVCDNCARLGVDAAVTDIHARGGEGGRELAEKVVAALDAGTADFRPLYPLGQPLAAKIETIAREIYRARDVAYTSHAQRDIKRLEDIGMGDVPICMAKTQYSFSDDPSLRGAPEGFTITVREVTPSAGAGFVVAHTGDIMTMPGLPKRPAAENMRVAADGTITGLF
ncbi:MAG TPA: formate--tetrahydrofolate ligase [Longimicrobiales bacterium]|nr:formate--tetrahydrofolate ligase [Longimicrobiales bacterium]